MIPTIDITTHESNIKYIIDKFNLKEKNAEEIIKILLDNKAFTREFINSVLPDIFGDVIEELEDKFDDTYIPEKTSDAHPSTELVRFINRVVGLPLSYKSNKERNKFYDKWSKIFHSYNTHDRYTFENTVKSKIEDFLAEEDYKRADKLLKFAKDYLNNR